MNRSLLRSAAPLAATFILLAAGIALTRGATGGDFFMPHAHCYLFNRDLMRLHGGSDFLIGASYVSISATLVWLVYRARKELPFHWIMLAFAIFIVACGATHFMELWTLTAAHPQYWLAGWVKLITAIASVTTAVVLPPLVPRILAMMEGARLSAERRQALEGAYAELNKRYTEEHSVDLAGMVRELVQAKEALERKSAELAEQRELFRVTLSSIGDAVITTNTQAKVTFLNPVAEALTGWTFGEAEGQPLEKVFHIINEDTRQPVENPIDRVLLEGVVVGLANHTTLIAKVGTETPIEDSAAPIRDAGGTTVGAVMVFHDVTERRRTERALRQSEASFRTLGDSIAQLAWAAHADGFIHWYNRRWYEYTGTTPEQMEGWGWQSVHDPEVLPAVLEKWRASIALGEPFEMEFPLRGADGIFRTFLTRAIPQRDSAGRVTQWFGTNTDVSEHIESEARLRESAEALRAASRAKDEFLAALSHELRTPLTPVLMLAADMEQSADLPEPVRRDFAMIRKNVELEARIIDDLLDLTRITHGKLALRFETVDVHSLIEHALAILRGDGEAKGLVIALDLAAAQHHVSGDAVRLQQVIWNVLKNAIKFTPHGGRIAIQSSNEDGHLRVACTDTGLGITDEEMPRIFTAFTQGHEASAPRFGGLGLGLSITALLVREHRGRIWAESAGRDQGSTFHLELPSTAAPAADLPPPQPASEPSARALRILLVEDHDDTRGILVRLMTRWGHSVSVAASVAQARATIASGDFDLLLSDLGLPDGTGHDVIAALREKSEAPAVAMSGYGMEADLARSKTAGFTEHIVKPVSAERLREVLTRFSAP